MLPLELFSQFGVITYQQHHLTGILLVNIFKLYCYFFTAILFTGCATANDPINVYDENLVLDKKMLSIIYVPADIEVLEVDGMQIKPPFIEQGYNTVVISAGSHRLTVKYVALWGDATSGSIVSSKPVVLSFDIAPKSTYYIKFNIPKDPWQAEHLANIFAPWMEDASGKKVKTVNHQAAKKLPISASKSMMKQALTPGDSSLDKLKFWWKSASFKEKKAFENWMGEN